MAQTDGKLGLNYAAGSEVTSWNDVAENMRKIDSFATQIDGKMTDDAADLEAFKGSVIDGADEIWATTQDGIPAGAHGVSRLVTSIRTTISQKVAELTEKITANTAKADANAADIEMLNSKLSNMCDGGVVSTTIPTNTHSIVKITFNKTFQKTPAFTCQLMTSQVAADKIIIKSVTSTGAEVYAYSITTAHTAWVHWSAVSLDY